MRHSLTCVLSNFPDSGGVIIEEIRIFESFLQIVALTLIIVTEDRTPEILDLSYNIPAFVILNVFLDIVNNPEQEVTCGGQFVDELIHGLFFYLYIIKSNGEVGCQVKFARKVAEYTLEETVDSLHAEIVVVMDKVCQGFTGTL